MIIGQMVAQKGEAFGITADFTNELAPSETVVSCVVTSRNYATGADTSATFLDGAAEIIASPLITKRKVAGGGAHGETHIVQFKATTSAPNTYEHEVEVMVSES